MSRVKRFGLPKQYLLRKTQEFDQVYREGARVKGRGFAVLFFSNGTAFSRLGVSVHRKLRGSVRRNRIKRIIKETFRLHREVFPDSCDIVITVNPYFNFRTSASLLDTFVSLCLTENGKRVI